MSYPTKAEVAGKIYPLNTDYRVALQCFDIIEDPDISDEERALAVIYKLFGFVPVDNVQQFMQAAAKFLSCGESQDSHRARRKDMDFGQDAKYIAASFMSDYRIDIEAEDMHFWKYYALLCGLTDKCVLSRVRDLRTFDLSEIKDAKTRCKMAESKQAVALKPRLSAEEKRAIEEFEALFAE